MFRERGEGIVDWRWLGGLAHLPCARNLTLYLLFFQYNLSAIHSIIIIIIIILQELFSF